MAAILTLLLALPAARHADAGPVARPAHDFELIDVNPNSPEHGKKVRLSRLYAERGLVLNFVASWCMPCREELPRLQAVQDSGAARVVCVAADEYGGPDALQILIEESRLTVPVLYAPDAQAEILAEHYDYTFLPATYFIRATGDVAAVHQGLLPEATLREQIAEHLGPTRPHDAPAKAAPSSGPR